MRQSSFAPLSCSVPCRLGRARSLGRASPRYRSQSRSLPGRNVRRAAWPRRHPDAGRSRRAGRPAAGPQPCATVLRSLHEEHAPAAHRSRGAGSPRHLQSRPRGRRRGSRAHREPTADAVRNVHLASSVPADETRTHTVSAKDLTSVAWISVIEFRYARRLHLARKARQRVPRSTGRHDAHRRQIAKAPRQEAGAPS